MSADRISGAFFLFFGLAMVFAIIPVYVETVDDGNIAPATLPTTVSWIIAICGLWLLLRPTKHQLQDSRYMLTAGLYVLLLIFAIVAISKFGFISMAPGLALLIMGMLGERRWYWLVLGAGVMPALIWIFVVLVLDRSLPGA